MVKTGFFIMSIGLAVLCSCGHPTGRNNLYFHPETGKTYTFQLSRDDSSYWDYGGHRVVPKSVEQVFFLQALPEKDSMFQISVRLGEFRMTGPPLQITSDGRVVRYFLDSIPSKPTDPHNHLQLSYYLLGLTRGLSTVVLIDRKGTVREVRGFEELVDSVAGRSMVPGEFIRRTLRDYFGEEAMSDNLNQLFSIAPDHPEIAKDNWVRNSLLKRKAPVKWSSSYGVKSIAGDSVFLDVTSSISGWASSSATNPFMEGSGEGRVVLSASTGIPYLIRLRAIKKTKTDSYTINESEEINGSLK